MDLININSIEGMKNDESIFFQVNKEDKLFGMPDDYFSRFPEKILSIVHLEEMDKTMNYSIPDQYFSELPNKILRKIEEEETPFLKTLSKENVYAVAENYFENNPQRIIKKINGETEAKVISINTNRSRWQMVAAAAAVVIMAVSTSLFLGNKKMKSNNHQYYASVLSSNSLEQSLSGLSNSEISNYLNTPDPSSDNDVSDENAPTTQKDMGGISNEAMENYLNQTPAVY